MEDFKLRWISKLSVWSAKPTKVKLLQEVICSYVALDLSFYESMGCILWPENLSGVPENMYYLPKGACFLIEMTTPPKGNSLEIIQRKYIKLSS